MPDNDKKIHSVEEVADLAIAVYGDGSSVRSGREYLDKILDLAAKYRGRVYLGPDFQLSMCPALEKHLEGLADGTVLICLNGVSFSPQVLEAVAGLVDGGLYYDEASAPSGAGIPVDEVYMTVPEVKADKVLEVLETYLAEVEQAAAYITVHIGDSKANAFGVRGTDLPDIVDLIESSFGKIPEGKRLIVLALPVRHAAVSEIREVLSKISESGGGSFEEVDGVDPTIGKALRKYFVVMVNDRDAQDAQAFLGSIMKEVSQTEE